MSENVNVEVQSVLDRINQLNESRNLIEVKKGEIEVHEKDLKAIETIKGVSSDDYQVKKEVLDVTKKELENAEKEVEKLSFKRSELKPTFDELAKKFENELRAEQEREFYIEIGPVLDFSAVDENNNPVVTDGNGVEITDKEAREKQNVGRKAFKTLMEYLYHDVKWTAKTAPGLLVLVRNMEENKDWTRASEFNNVISLRSSNVLVLWRNILEEMEGKGFYDARKFLEVWANCGKGISETVREIQKQHEGVRQLGSQLNTVEDEYLRSENDLPEEDTELTTGEEVNPTL